MTRPTQRIKQVFVLSTCALALSAFSGMASAHVCMKKPYGQGYMTPMYPHYKHGYAGPMKPYAYPEGNYREHAYRQGLKKGAEQPAQNQDTPTSTNTAPQYTHEPDIIETATAAGDFNTLVKAVVAADLYDTLREQGPFTLFAPTDAAFADLPDGMLDELLADKDMLVAVLNYHLVPGRLTAADLLQQREVTTIQGQKLSVNDLNVVSADNETVNGIIHVIDNVMVPSL